MNHIQKHSHMNTHTGVAHSFVRLLVLAVIIKPTLEIAFHCCYYCFVVHCIIHIVKIKITLRLEWIWMNQLFSPPAHNLSIRISINVSLSLKSRSHCNLRGNNLQSTDTHNRIESNRYEKNFWLHIYKWMHTLLIELYKIELNWILCWLYVVMQLT